MKFITEGTDISNAQIIKNALTQHPNAILISGNDDWYAAKEYSPNYFLKQLGFEDQIITKISLIFGSASSGCIIKKHKWKQIKQEYKKMFNKNIEHLSIFTAKEFGLVIERKKNK